MVESGVPPPESTHGVAAAPRASLLDILSMPATVVVADPIFVVVAATEPFPIVRFLNCHGLPLPKFPVLSSSTVPPVRLIVPLPVRFPVCTSRSPVPAIVPLVSVSEYIVVVEIPDPLSSDQLPPEPLNVTSYRDNACAEKMDFPVVVALNVIDEFAGVNAAPEPTKSPPPIE